MSLTFKNCERMFSLQMILCRRCISFAPLVIDWEELMELMFVSYVSQTQNENCLVLSKISAA